MQLQRGRGANERRCGSTSSNTSGRFQPLPPPPLPPLRRMIDLRPDFTCVFVSRPSHECVERSQILVTRDVHSREGTDLLRDVPAVNRSQAGPAELNLVVESAAPLIYPAIAWVQRHRVVALADFVLRQGDANGFKARKRNVGSLEIVTNRLNPRCRATGWNGVTCRHFPMARSGNALRR